LAARSRYSGAVSLTLETEKLSAAKTLLQKVAHDSA